jgi:hypothetical protein
MFLLNADKVKAQFYVFLFFTLNPFIDTVTLLCSNFLDMAIRNRLKIGVSNDSAQALSSNNITCYKTVGTPLEIDCFNVCYTCMQIIISNFKVHEST